MLMCYSGGSVIRGSWEGVKNGPKIKYIYAPILVENAFYMVRLGRASSI